MEARASSQSRPMACRLGPVDFPLAPLSVFDRETERKEKQSSSPDWHRFSPPKTVKKPSVLFYFIFFRGGGVLVSPRKGKTTIESKRLFFRPGPLIFVKHSKDGSPSGRFLFVFICSSEGECELFFRLKKDENLKLFDSIFF